AGSDEEEEEHRRHEQRRAEVGRVPAELDDRGPGVQQREDERPPPHAQTSGGRGLGRTVAARRTMPFPSTRLPTFASASASVGGRTSSRSSRTPSRTRRSMVAAGSQVGSEANEPSRIAPRGGAAEPTRKRTTLPPAADFSSAIVP